MPYAGLQTSRLVDMNFSPTATTEPPKKAHHLGTAWEGKPLRGVWHFASRAVASLVAGILLAHLAIGLFAVEMGVIYSVVNPPFTALMAERALLSRYKPVPREFIPLRKIPARVQTMFVRVEDSGFYLHPGIDLKAIEHAYLVNKAAGSIVLGGSTITQQLVRTLALSQSKTYLRKYVEALMAVTVNAVMSKQRQLELYLNYIEWGKGVYGIGTASRYYYGKPLSGLNLDQTIRLAVIITSPLRYNVSTFARNGGMVERYDFLWSIQ